MVVFSLLCGESFNMVHYGFVMFLIKSGKIEFRLSNYFQRCFASGIAGWCLTISGSWWSSVVLKLHQWQFYVQFLKISNISCYQITCIISTEWNIVPFLLSFICTGRLILTWTHWGKAQASGYCVDGHCSWYLNFIVLNLFLWIWRRWCFIFYGLIFLF